MDQGAGLSIIIPNYRERHLMSVYGQCRLVFPQAEIILQDDLDGMGKGWAIREGLRKASKGIVCFLDGDMDIEPSEIKTLMNYIYNYDIVIGKRIYNSSIKRKILNLGYKSLVRLLFGLRVDTQSGIKMFHKYRMPTWETDSFAYDVEILAKAKQAGDTMKEVPIKCHIREGKSLSAVWHTFIETLRVWKRV